VDLTPFLQSIVNGLALSGIYILVALGLALVLSIMGIVQISHGEIYMLGAYIVYGLTKVLGLDFFPSLLISMFSVGLVGVLLERLCFRPFRGSPDRAFTISLALILILQNVVLSMAGGDPHTYTSPISGVLRFFGVAISWKRVFILIVGFGLLLLLFVLVKRTKVGQAMLAASQEKDGASLLGIDIDSLSALAMFVGCALAALAGILMGSLFSIYPTMGSFALMKAMAVIILGGLGSLGGAVIGGLLLGLIDGILPVFTTTHIAGMVGFGAIILVLIFRPQGIAGHE